MDKGYIHIYTGDGKGKTTAALGLALRAAGHGYKTYIGQFMKGQYYGELSSIKNIPQITIEQFGDTKCITREQVQEYHKKQGKSGIEHIKNIMKQNEHKIIILDEVCVALWFNIISLDDIIEIIKLKNENTELILTGRKAPEKLINMADLVTEMKEIKHYYNTHGVLARNGIEK